MTACANFNGVIPPVAMPLTADRELDCASLKQSIDRMINRGVHGLFLLGSSSEVVFCIDSYRREIVEMGIETAVDRAPVLVDIIDAQTGRVAEHAHATRGLGADTVVAITPFYALGSPNEVETNFRVIHEEVDLPLFTYDPPVCVHKKLDADMLVGLGSEGVLASIRGSSGDDVNFRFLIQKNQAAGSPLKLFTGHEAVVGGTFLFGADGAAPELDNVDPYGYIQRYEAYRKGGWDAVARIQDGLVLLMTITSMVEGTVGFGAGVEAFKIALQLLGVFETNQMPRPVRALEGGNIEAVRNMPATAGMLTR